MAVPEATIKASKVPARESEAMSKIPAAEAARMFEEIKGWPYRLGGTGAAAASGIDCSGAWVRVYRAFRKAIFHGSNSQFRRHCFRTGPINGNPGALRVGMAVFKRRNWREIDKGHSQYGQPPGDMYHVGCVTGVNPLRIVHATGPAAKADASLGTKMPGAWTDWGMLAEVEYGEGSGGGSLPGGGPGGSGGSGGGPGGGSGGGGLAGPVMAAVRAGSGGRVRMRARPSTSEPLWWWVPVGAVVPVYGVKDGWAQISFGGRNGYMMSGFLREA